MIFGMPAKKKMWNDNVFLEKKDDGKKGVVSTTFLPKQVEKQNLQRPLSGVEWKERSSTPTHDDNDTAKTTNTKHRNCLDKVQTSCPIILTRCFDSINQLLKGSYPKWTPSQRGCMIHHMIQFLELKIRLGREGATTSTTAARTRKGSVMSMPSLTTTSPTTTRTTAVSKPSLIIVSTPAIDMVWKVLVSKGNEDLYIELIRRIQKFRHKPTIGTVQYHPLPSTWSSYPISSSSSSVFSRIDDESDNVHYTEMLRRTQHLYRIAYKEAMPMYVEKINEGEGQDKKEEEGRIGAQRNEKLHMLSSQTGTASSSTDYLENRNDEPVGLQIRFSSTDDKAESLRRHHHHHHHSHDNFCSRSMSKATTTTLGTTVSTPKSMANLSSSLTKSWSSCSPSTLGSGSSICCNNDNIFVAREDRATKKTTIYPSRYGGDNVYNRHSRSFDRHGESSSTKRRPFRLLHPASMTNKLPPRPPNNNNYNCISGGRYGKSSRKFLQRRTSQVLFPSSPA